jgi:hypothetical protein
MAPIGSPLCIPKSLTVSLAPQTLGCCPIKAFNALFAFSTGSPDRPTPILITILPIEISFIGEDLISEFIPITP